MPSSAFKKCARSEEHTSELQSHDNLVCRLLLEKKKIAAVTGAEAVVGATGGVARCAPTRARRRPAPRTSAPTDRLSPARGRSAGFFFFNDPAPPEIYPLSLHDALPICAPPRGRRGGLRGADDSARGRLGLARNRRRSEEHTSELQSHDNIVCRLLL